jgi:hypothetical protein
MMRPTQSRTFRQSLAGHGFGCLQSTDIPAQRICFPRRSFRESHGSREPDIESFVGIAMWECGDAIRQAHDLAIEAWHRQTLDGLPQ